MACTLSKSVKPGVDFEATKGQEFTITIVPETGSTLRFVAADYAGKSISGTKAKFTAVAGKQSLVVTYAAVKDQERGNLTENCSGGGTNDLRGIRSTSVFTRQYIVEA